MNVSKLMCHVVITCRPEDSLDSAAKLWDHDIGCLPVVDEDNRPLGMLTDRDICMAAYTQGRLLPDVAEGELVSRLACICEPRRHASLFPAAAD